MKVLVDSDISVYAITNQSQRSNPDGEPFEYILHSLKLQTAKIIKEAGGDPLNSSTYQLYLSGPTITNFRYEVDPQYKAKRPKIKPRYWSEARDYLREQWGARVCHGEADDALAKDLYTDYKEAEYEASYFTDETKDCTKTILASIDKDLMMVPGWHYNWKREEKVWVTPEEGMMAFWHQMLTGDAVDNIQGLKGVGPKTADKLLAGATDNYAVILQAYAERGVPFETIYDTADLLWMVRDGNRGSKILQGLKPNSVAMITYEKYNKEEENGTDTHST